MHGSAPPRPFALARLLASLSIALLITAGLAAAAPARLAGGELALDYLGARGQPMLAIVDGERAYTARGTTLSILDIADPARPRELGALSEPLQPNFSNAYQAIAVSGQYLYATLDPGFVVVDVADPASPHVVARLSKGQGSEVIVEGQRAYLVYPSGPSSVQISVVDITDPRSPALLPNFLSLSNHRDHEPDVDIQGNLAFIGDIDAGGVEIYDVTNFQAPRQIGSISALVDKLDIVGSVAYVYTITDQLLIFDIADPSAPRLLATYRPAPLKSFTGQIHVAGGVAYLAIGSDLFLIDVSDPAAPKLRSKLAVVGEVWRLQVDDALLSLTADGGWQTFDVANTDAPVALSIAPQLRWWPDVAVDGRRAYVAELNASGLRVLDLSDPSRLTQLSAQLDRESGPLVVRDDLVFVSESFPASGLHVFQADGAGGLKEMSYLRGSPPQKLALYDKHLLSVVRGGANGEVVLLQVIDIANPTAPRLRGSVTLPDIPLSLVADGDRAYALNPSLPPLYDSRTLIGYDLSDPDAPVERWRYVDAAGSGQDSWRIYWQPGLAVDGDLAFLANGEELRLLDLSDPAGPRPRGVYPGTKPLGVALQPDIAYIAGPLGLEAIDVSDPDTPALIAKSALAMPYVKSVQVVDDPCQPGATFVYVVSPYALHTFYAHPAGSPGPDPACGAEPTATATNTPTTTATASATPSPTATASPTASPSATTRATVATSATATPSATASPTATVAPPPRLGYTIYLPGLRR